MIVLHHLVWIKLITTKCTADYIVDTYTCSSVWVFVVLLSCHNDVITTIILYYIIFIESTASNWTYTILHAYVNASVKFKHNLAFEKITMHTARSASMYTRMRDVWRVIIQKFTAQSSPNFRMVSLYLMKCRINQEDIFCSGITIIWREMYRYAAMTRSRWKWSRHKYTSSIMWNGTSSTQLLYLFYLIIIYSSYIICTSFIYTY